MFDGLNVTTALVAILNLLIGGLLVAVVKSRPALKKIAADREANLLSERAEEMQEMRKRMERLEAEMKDAAKAHASEQERRARQREAEKSIERHRYNNLNAAFNALLMLLKQGVPIAEAVEAVEKMRAEHLDIEAKEAATIRAALIKDPGK